MLSSASHIVEISTEKSPLKGILLCLLSYVFFSLIGFFEKFMNPSISVWVILFFQSFICLLFLLPRINKNTLRITDKKLFASYFIRIASGLGCYATLFYLIKYIPISQALLYQYSASLWIPFIMLLWLKVRMPQKQWLGIIIGFMGISVILDPSLSSVGFISFCGILCGILQGISVIAIRKLSVTEPVIRVLFYYFLIGSLVLLPVALLHASSIKAQDGIFLFAVGAVTYIAQRLFALSLLYAHPSTLAPISYSCIVFAGVLAWLFWHEMPNERILFGMCLVITGCLLTMFLSRSSKNKNPILGTT